VAFFLSYRRNDVADMVGRLHDRLSMRFGAHAVFRDVDSIAVGADFRRALEHALQESRALVAVIGPKFLPTPAPSGADYVVEEIALALERALPIVPVLVSTVPMPSADQLPARIRPLSFLQACRLRGDPDFSADAERLIKVLGSLAPLAQRAESAPVLELVSGPHKGRTYVIDKERTLIGRSDQCDVILEAAFASQYHATIVAHGAELLVEDLGSTNGTFVNGQRVTGRVQLAHGALIQIGSSILQVHMQTRQEGLAPQSPLRVTLHVAAFVATGTPCCFINVTNLSPSPLELTHVWLASTPPAFPRNEDRPLPKRLEPQESWETWIPLETLPAYLTQPAQLFQLARARLSNGAVVHSVANEVPGFGTVPGGKIRKAP
jgi:hypothetical protein